MGDKISCLAKSIIKMDKRNILSKCNKTHLTQWDILRIWYYRYGITDNCQNILDVPPSPRDPPKLSNFQNDLIHSSWRTTLYSEHLQILSFQFDNYLGIIFISVLNFFYRQYIQIYAASGYTTNLSRQYWQPQRIRFLLPSNVLRSSRNINLSAVIFYSAQLLEV